MARRAGPNIDFSVFNYEHVRETACVLMQKGYDVVPLSPGEKRAAHKDWNEVVYDPAQPDNAFPPGMNYNIGVKLGVEILDGRYLIGFDIDVDNEEYITNVRCAIGAGAPRKRGAKGQTIFACTAAPLRTLIRKVGGKAFKKVYGSAEANTKIEMLGDGFQTVIPPSIHPEGMLYQWLGRSEPGHRLFNWDSPTLLDIDPIALPLIDEWVIEEIICASERPHLQIFGLNHMQWNGPDGGGNVHDTVLAAIGSMVAAGFPNDAIERRVKAAAGLCLSSLANPTLRQRWDDRLFARAVGMMIDGARVKEFEKAPAKRIPMDRKIANYLAEQLGGQDNLWNQEGLFRVYHEGHWPIYPETKLRQMAVDSFAEASASNISGAISLVTQSIARDRPFSLGAEKVCLLNGTYHVRDGVFRDWQPADNLVNQLPFNYTEDVESPVYDRFIADTFWGASISADDQLKAIEVFEEFVGYTLLNSTAYQKALVIKGPPASGKSTLGKIITMLHGSEFFSAVGLNYLGRPEYLSQMDGKLVNISGETKILSTIDDDAFKKIVGGDPLMVKRLYVDPIMRTLSTRLVILCNEMFHTVDTSGAVERRLILLRAENSRIEAARQDPELDKKLNKELPGIFHLVMKGVRNLLERGHFDPPKYHHEIMQGFTQMNNPVLQWFMTRTDQGIQKYDDPTHYVNGAVTLSTDCYADYAEWTNTNGFKPLNSTNFGMKLNEIGYPSVNTRVGTNILKCRHLSLFNPMKHGKY